MDSDKKTCNIIDIAVPVDAGIVEKEKEKVEKYQDLRREVARLWNVKANVVPIVVGALGVVTPNLSKHLDAIGVTTRIELLRPGHTRRQVAATCLCDKLLHVYYLQNKSLRHDDCSVHMQ